MFQFNGTAAAEASVNARERDWRVADHYNIQQLGKRPFTTMLHPTLHQRSLTEDLRRPSLLQSRSRSNSSIASQTCYDGTGPAPNLWVDRSAPRTSTERRSISGESVHIRSRSSGGFGKTLMAKGSKLLRRQNSKHDLTSLHTLDWLEDVNGRNLAQETSRRPGSMHSRTHPLGDDASPRLNISEPFNFQHLTHTTPQHVQRIQQKNNHSDLISDFSAIRASQAPHRELRGIKAMDIQQGIYFSEASASETSSPPRTGYSNSPPLSPARNRDRLEHSWSNPASPVRTLGNKRSIENFSQPSPSYHTAQSSPISPSLVPPRSSSRSIALDFFTIHQESLANNVQDSLSTAEAAEGLDTLDYPIATCSQEAYDFSLPHAVTTPDDTAHAVRPPPFSMVRTELAGVPEEEELSEGKRSSIATSIVRPTTPTSSIRHAKSFPSTKSSPHRRSGVLPRTSEEDDQCACRQSVESASSTGSRWEEHTAEVPARPHPSRRLSIRREESWEDVIDYCYEHEAEADCNFDWELASNPDQRSSLSLKYAHQHGDGDKQSSEHTAASPSGQYRPVPIHPSAHAFSPPPLMPLQTSLPDLQAPPASSVESSFSSIPEAVTPLSMNSTIPSKLSLQNTKDGLTSANNFPVVVHDDSGSEYAFDDLYQEMLASRAATDNQMLFTTGRVDGSTISNSPRSSRSPISKSSSQESFWYSQANTAARRHRNTGSVGSLPELIQSRSIEKVELVSNNHTDQVGLLSVSDAAVDGMQHRRSSTLAKDVALKAMLSKVVTPEDGEVPELPLPLHPAFRDRAISDASPLVMGGTMPPPPPPPPQPTFTRRMRSTSSASSFSSRKSNRASYSLFPSPASR